MTKVKNRIILLLRFFFQPVIRSANRVNWRFSRPYNCSPTIIKSILPLLSPGMVVLTRKKYEFSNWWISGYWKHSAIVVSEGRIVEANRLGVVQNEIEKALSVSDDFVVLKPKFCDIDAMNNAACFAQRMTGKAYNFYFFPVKDLFYCTELIYRAYASVLSASGKGNPFSLTSNQIIKPSAFFEQPETWKKVVSMKECKISANIHNI